jgi:hypothetical protein
MVFSMASLGHLGVFIDGVPLLHVSEILEIMATTSPDSIYCRHSGT